MMAQVLLVEPCPAAASRSTLMVLWQLPHKTPDRPHGLKYRLDYGLGDGTCLVRFDNESDKGDHKRLGSQAESYRFIDVETLVADFLAEIKKARRK